MKSPIENHVKGIFIPVSSIEEARDWYCSLLNLKPGGEILFGHIYVLPMQGKTNIILDSKIYSPEHVHKVPVVQLGTLHIEEAYQYLQGLHVEMITDIQNGHWFGSSHLSLQ